MWDHLPVESLIDRTGYGLAPKRWRAQLEALRALPEVKDRNPRAR
jgi:hypothetical protein